MKSKGSEAFAPLSAAQNYPQFTDNEYTAGGNREAMETAGAVFLPAAGRFLNYDSEGRVGEYGGEGESGFYWHSTAKDANKAYCIAFLRGSFYPSVVHYRIEEHSVRLVRDVK